MKISRMANSIEPSLSRQLYNMAKSYDDVIDLTLGDPDIQPNGVIKQAAIDSIVEGKTRYSANAGLIELREKICDMFQEEYNQKVSPEKECIVTVGAMEALFLAFASIIDYGDEVIMPGPYYINYYQMVEMLGGKPVVVDTAEEDNFKISIDKIERVLTDRTVAIVINSPSNPSGQILSEEALNDIAQLAVSKDLIVISDEVYKSLIYDAKKHKSIMSFENMGERCVVIDSISKRFSMTGYRLGYAIGPEIIISNMVKMQENVCACAPLPSQYAAIEAYSQCRTDDYILKVFENRRNYIYDAVNRIKGLKCIKPEGTFYLLVNISKSGMSSFEFACRLLEKEHIAVVPAITYGKTYDNYIRIAFTVDVEILKEAVARISNFMGELV